MMRFMAGIPVFVFSLTASSLPVLAGQPGFVETIGGGGSSFAEDILATQANLGSIRGYALSRSGNIYVFNGSLNILRRISPEGIVNTIAGGGFNGRGDDGPALQAAFTSVNGIVCDLRENIYIIDGNDIRRVTSDGIVSTILKTQSGVWAIKLAPNGNLLLVTPDGLQSLNLDTFTLSQLTKKGDLTIYKESMLLNDIRFVHIDSFCFNNQGNLLLSASVILTSTSPQGAPPIPYPKVFIVNKDNVVQTLKAFPSPPLIEVDIDGSMFYTQTIRDANQISKITPDGTIISIAGPGGDISNDIPAKLAKIGSFGTININASGDFLYSDVNRIRKINGVAKKGIYFTDIYTTHNPIVVGDIDGNGSISIQDAVLSLRITVGQISPTDTQRQTADINADGVINIIDVTRLLKIIIGL